MYNPCYDGLISFRRLLTETCALFALHGVHKASMPFEADLGNFPKTIIREKEKFISVGSLDNHI